MESKLYNELRKLSVFMIILAISLMAAGNDTTSINIYEGKIIDSETKQPIVFANVYVSGTSVGTVSNSDGEFVLKVPNANINKNVSIAYIGYKTYEEALNKLNAINNLIKLDKDPFAIKEVIIRTDDPLKLLKMALNKVNENYLDKPAMLTAFYRETIKQNRNYVAVSEAIMDIYKSSYTSDFSTDRVKIFKGRKSSDVDKMDTVIFKLQGGPRTSIYLDIIKNPSNLLSPEYFDYYNYSFAGIINIDGKQNYVISFEQKEDLDMPLFAGNIYLEMNNLAITRLDFKYSDIGLEDANQQLVKKKPANMKIDVVSGNYLVKYRELDGKWYLNHVRSELKFKCKWQKRLFRSMYSTMFEMAVTKLNTENVEKFKLSESAKFSDVFVDQVQYFEDKDFWGDYNYIKPDESIESAILKIQKKLVKN